MDGVFCWGSVAAVAILLTVRLGTLSRKRPRVLWFVPVLTALGGTFILIVGSTGESILAFLATFVGGVAVTFATATLAVIVYRQGKRAGERGLGRWTVVLVQLVVVAAVVVGASFNVVFNVRFAASRTALEQTATSVIAGGRPGRLPRSIGLFRVREIDRAGNAVRFIVGEVSVDDFGLVYSPDGEPPAVGEDSYERIAGDWWGWRRSW